jgi:hypothetical protein
MRTDGLQPTEASQPQDRPAPQTANREGAEAAAIPEDVKRAAGLIFISAGATAVVGCGQWVFASQGQGPFTPYASNPAIGGILIGSLLGSIGLSILFAKMMLRRRNWARLVFIAVYTLGLLFVLPSLNQLSANVGSGVWFLTVLGFAGGNGLQGWAVYLLLKPVSKCWFKVVLPDSSFMPPGDRTQTGTAQGWPLFPKRTALGMAKKHWIVVGALSIVVGWLTWSNLYPVAAALFGGTYQWGIYFGSEQNVGYVRLLSMGAIIAGVGALIYGYLKEK